MYWEVIILCTFAMIYTRHLHIGQPYTLKLLCREAARILYRGGYATTLYTAPNGLIF